MATDTLSPTKPAPAATDPDRPTNKVIPALLLVGLLAALIVSSVWAALWISWKTRMADNEEIKFVFRRLEEAVRPFGDASSAPLVQALRMGLLFGVPILFGGLAAGALVQRRRGRATPWLLRAGLASTGLGTLYIAYSLLFLGLSRNINGWLFWVPLLLLYSTVFIAYAVWMYVQDGRQVGWLWASFLGLLRVSVYALLVLVFLLPALQAWDKSESFSRVLVLLDLSGSMGLSDDPPREDSAQPPRSRLDQVVALFTKGDGEFFKGKGGEKKGLLDANPVYVYAFGGRLDDEAKEFKKDGQPWPESEWNGFVRLDPRQWILDGLSPAGRELVQNSAGFLGTPTSDPAVTITNWFKETGVLEQLSAEDKTLLEKKRDILPKKLEARQQIVAGTNYADALFGLATRESNNMLAGVVVIGDGQSNQGSASTLAEALNRFNNLKVPVFTIAVGDYREQVNIRVTDLQVPEMSPPDEKFPVRVVVEGEGLADQDFACFLDLFKPGQDPAKDKPAHTLPTQGKFKGGSGVPHGQIELVIDPAAPEMASLRKAGDAKPELEEGEWKFRARVPKAKGEVFAGREHVSEVPASIQLVKRPLRVLLFSGGAGKEFQFCRRLFVNEADKKRAELSIFQQVTDPRGDRALDVPPERLLKQFPNVYEDKKDSADKAEDRYYNLARYDLIIAFDPDWTRVAPESLKLLEQWVDAGGGLIALAGPINTYQLARGANEKPLAPVLNLYPVRVDDSRLSALGVERSTTQPFALNFPGASTETEFLKLDDDPKSKYPLAGWSEFFHGKPKEAVAPQDPVQRGFFSFYPVKSVKQGATVVATFGDPQVRMPDDAKGAGMAFLVTMPSKKGKVVYIGWEGSWRLRQFKEEYFERFWTKLARYAGSGNLTRQSRRGVPIMGRQFVAGRPIGFEAQLFQQNMQPLANTADPRIKITPPPGVILARSEFTLEPKREGSWEGYFRTRFTLNAPGKYQLELPIPGSDEILRREFHVKEVNLELDNSRPDLATLESMASEVGKLRVGDDKKAELRKQLRNLHRPESGDKSAGVGKDGDARLFFDLNSARLIPEYLIADRKSQLSRGRVEDLWSDGPTFDATDSRILLLTVSTLLFAVGLGLAVLGVVLLGRGAIGGGLTALVLGGVLAATIGGLMLFRFSSLSLNSMTVSTVLFIAVGLLSAEWLTRKLLKLA